MRDEIPQWCWYNGMLLFALADYLETEPNKSVRNFFDDFKAAHQLQNIQFNIKNQGLLISLLYGLLVVPKEMWEPKGTKTNFVFNTRNQFTTTSSAPFSTDEFLRLLRNAVAHANFEVDIEKAIYRFWNTNPRGERTFEVTVTHGGLGEFIGEVGKYFINQVRQPRA